MSEVLVQDWMTHEVITISPESSLDEADELINEAGIRRLPILDNGQLTGILTLGDVRAAKATAAADMTDYHQQAKVRDLMTPDPITIPKTASLGLAAQTMLQLKVSGLPVVDENGGLCGLLSESDLFRYIVENVH